MVQQKNEISEANLSHQSKSTISREQDCESESRGKRQGLSLNYKANLKCHEAADEVEKIDSVASTKTNSVSKGIDSKTTQSNRLNYGEGDSHSQHGTESSCSNSLLSNHSRQETGKEVHSFRSSGLTIDSSNSESVERRSEEPALVSSESDVLAHVVHNAVRNAMKISSLVGSLSSLNRNKENEDNSQEWGGVMLTHENATGRVLEQNDTNCKRVVCSDDDSNSLNLRNKAREDPRSRNEPDNSPSFHSEERIMDPQSTQGCDNILAVEGKILEVGTVAMDRDLTGNELSGPSMIQPDKVSVRDQDTYIAGFDLNEDLNANEMDDYVGPDETISSPEVIRVVAKAGILRGSPMSPLKFEGRMGLTGSANTSAFRNVVPSKTMDQHTCSSSIKSPENHKQFSGIDLNVAAVEDIAPESQYVSSPSTLQDPVDDGTRRNKRLKIDLNYSLCDTGDDPVQPSVPYKPDNSLLVDLNVKASTEDKSNNAPLLSQVHPLYGNLTDPRRQELNYAGNNYWDGFRTMQQQLNAHGQQYLVAAAAPPYVLQPVESMQRVPHLQPPMLPFAVNGLSPQNYLSTVPFHFGSNNVRPSGTLPYVRFPQEQGGFSPQMLYPGNVQQSLITPSGLLNVVHDRSAGNVMTPSFKAGVKNDENLTANGSKKIEAGPSLFLGGNSVADQEAWYGISVNRKEPEGGSGYQQLGHR